MNEYEIDEEGLNKHREYTVKEIKKLLQKHNRVACVRYTGYGKSYFIVRRIIEDISGQIIIVVPNNVLLLHYQEQYNNNKDVIILTYQIIKNKTNEFIINNYNNVSLIIADECHHLSGEKWCKEFIRLEKLTKAKVLGLTATPETFINESIVNTFFNGIQVQPFNLVDGINSKFISKIKYVIAYSNLEDKQNIVDSRMSEIDRYKISNLLNVEKILNKHISSDYLEQNLKILVFVSRLKYIQEAYDSCYKWFKNIYKNKTINIFILNSNKTAYFNEIQLAKFKQKRDKNNIDIIISVDKLIEGLHLPEVRVAIMFRKTRSKRVYFQQIGRVTGTQTSLIFDFINNSSYLYAMRYNKFTELSTEIYNKNKIIYEELLELVDETKDIKLILDKYNQYYIIYNHKEEIELQSTKISYKQLFEYLNIKCSTEKFNNICTKLNIHFISKQEYQKLSNLEKWGRFKDEIIKNKDNLSIIDLAKKYGFNASTFNHFLLKNNIHINNLPFKRGISTKKYFDNIDYIKNNPDNLNKIQLARKIGISENAFNAITKRHNISIKNLTPCNGLKNQDAKTIIDENIEEIKLQLNENKSINQLSKEYNIKPEVFAHYLRKRYNLQVYKTYNLDLSYITNNPDNLTLEQLSDKFGYKYSYGLKARLLRAGITRIKYKNSYIDLEIKLDNNLKQVLELRRDYIINELKYRSKADLAREFGFSETKFKIGLTILNFPKTNFRDYSPINLLIKEHLEFIKDNCSKYTVGGMSTKLQEISGFKYSRSGISNQLIKLNLPFKK